jgi:hypothetical protein
VADNSNEKARQNKMIKTVAKLTNPAVILAAALGTILSPTVSMATPPAKATRHQAQIVHHSARQNVQFQGQHQSTPDRDQDSDNFYIPRRSPNFDELLH